jgi:hypothetical protein
MTAVIPLSCFQTADETWHAYNPYGGHSVYDNATWTLTDRAYKVSYNRPFNADKLESATWIYSAEYPMVQWLEANGSDITYFTSVDAARSGSLISNHKIYLSVGHDEYWSKDRRMNVGGASRGSQPCITGTTRSHGRSAPTRRWSINTWRQSGISTGCRGYL